MAARELGFRLLPATLRARRIGASLLLARGPRDESAVGWIVLQKSKVAAVKISGKNLMRKEVGDSCSLNRVTVAYEFGAGRCGQIFIPITHQQSSNFCDPLQNDFDNTIGIEVFAPGATPQHRPTAPTRYPDRHIMTALESGKPARRARWLSIGHGSPRSDFQLVSKIVRQSIACNASRSLFISRFQIHGVRPRRSDSSKREFFAACLTKVRKCRTTTEGSPWRDARSNGAFGWMGPSRRR